MTSSNEEKKHSGWRQVAVLFLMGFGSVALAAVMAGPVIFFASSASSKVSVDVPLPLPAPVVFLVGFLAYMLSAKLLFDGKVSFDGVADAVSSRRKSHANEKAQRDVMRRRKDCLEEASWVRWQAAKVFSGDAIDNADVVRLAQIVGEGLSMGIVDVDWALFNVADEVLFDKQAIRQWRTDIEAQRKTISDICSIWAHVLHGLLLDSQHIVWKSGDLHALGRDLGVDAMLETYAEGAELEHIIG